MPSSPYDLLVIGGGINGAGIARDAAGRGLSVLLAEQDDLAAATSQWSTKLIHGGLRYLEYYEFRLVAESLAEREVLLANAPHLVEPLSFVLPHEPHLRPAWMIRMGLFLYDHIGGRRTLPGSFGVDLAGSRWSAGLKPRFRKGFVDWFNGSIAGRGAWTEAARRAATTACRWCHYRLGSNLDCPACKATLRRDPNASWSTPKIAAALHGAIDYFGDSFDRQAAEAARRALAPFTELATRPAVSSPPPTPTGASSSSSPSAPSWGPPSSTSRSFSTRP